MAVKKASTTSAPLTRKVLIDLLNEDLAREFQAIIAYVNYSQVLKGAAYMNIAAELAVHATEELSHAIILSNQIDYLGGMPTTVTPKPVKTSEKAVDMLRFDLDNENETIRQYRRRIKQCDELGEFAIGRAIRADPPPGAGPPDCPRHRARHRRPQRRHRRLINNPAKKDGAGSPDPAPSSVNRPNYLSIFKLI